MSNGSMAYSEGSIAGAVVAKRFAAAASVGFEFVAAVPADSRIA